jgi:hypothetical protein
MRYSFILLAFILVGCEQLNNIEGLGGIVTEPSSPGLTNTEVIAGLREALSLGAREAADLASATDGFYKNDLLYIAFPAEAIKVKEKAIDLGLGSQVEKFELTLNRAAEEAAKEAAPIFLEAIKGMTVQDGFAILNGHETAATEYLQEKTNSELRNRFSPVVSDAIDKVELTSYWEPLVTAYNTASIFTGKEEVNTDLKSYVTEKAIEGLFVHIAREEKEIRENPQARVTDLLRRVFGS